MEQAGCQCGRVAAFLRRSSRPDLHQPMVRGDLYASKARFSEILIGAIVELASGGLDKRWEIVRHRPPSSLPFAFHAPIQRLGVARLPPEALALRSVLVNQADRNCFVFCACLTPSAMVPGSIFLLFMPPKTPRLALTAIWVSMHLAWADSTCYKVLAIPTLGPS